MDFSLPENPGQHPGQKSGQESGPKSGVNSITGGEGNVVLSCCFPLLFHRYSVVSPWIFTGKGFSKHTIQISQEASKTLPLST